MRNLKLTMRYDGTDFYGWQRQPGCRTVQDTLEATLATLTVEPGIRVQASGRTDSGVHALGQVGNFVTHCRIPTDVFPRALNKMLPDDLSILECVEMPESFNANRDAVRKLYRYVMHDAPARDPLMRRYSCHSNAPLDGAVMHRAAQVLHGTHDFHSFETEWPNRKSSIRTIHHIAVSRMGEYLWLDVEADGFLYNMVRAIAGTLMNIGRGHWPESDMARIIAAEDRREAGPTAPAQGLFLIRVTYA